MIADDGKIFLCSDLAQIELRVNFWVAGQLDALDILRQGEDIYASFGTEVFDTEVRKPKPTDSEEEALEFMLMRTVAKTAVLGLGYQMGSDKFMGTLKADPTLDQYFDSGVLDPAKCREIVDTFRDKYADVKQFWKDIEVAVQTAIKRKTVTVCGAISIDCTDGTLKIILPSSRILYYHSPVVVKKEKTVQVINKNGSKGSSTFTSDTIVYGDNKELYGGKLTENIVQAIARDAFAEMMIELETRDYPTLWHVHDEVIIQVDNDKKVIAKAEKDIEEVMGTSPVWAPDLPVVCEIHATERYTK